MTYMFREQPKLDSLSHFGVKGMRWGVRRAKRDAVITRVAEGKGSKLDKARTLARASGVDLIRGKGLQGAAQRKSDRNAARAERIENGQATVGDILVRAGSARTTDIFPSRGARPPKPPRTEKPQKPKPLSNTEQATALVNRAISNPTSNVVVNGQMMMNGQQFVNFMVSGGAFNPRTTTFVDD